MSRKIYNRLSFMAVSWLDESTLLKCLSLLMFDICVLPFQNVYGSMLANESI
jgi:hypothetical protein